MHNNAISVKNLTKEYEINVLDYKSFKRDLINFFKLNKYLNFNINTNKILALDNINFDQKYTFDLKV